MGRSPTKPNEPKSPTKAQQSLGPPPQRDANENRIRWEIVEELMLPFKSLITKPSNDENASREPGAGMLRRPLQAHREPA